MLSWSSGCTCALNWWQDGSQGLNPLGCKALLTGHKLRDKGSELKSCRNSCRKIVELGGSWALSMTSLVTLVLVWVTCMGAVKSPKKKAKTSASPKGKRKDGDLLPYLKK